MARHYEEHVGIYQALTGIARRKGTFTTTQLREELGFDQGSPEAQTMHNLIVTLKKADIVKPTAAGRKRHQTLYVDPDKRTDLEARFKRAQRLAGNERPANEPAPSAPPPSTPRVVKALEQRVQDLEARLQDLAPLVASADQLAAMPEKLDLLRTDVDKLVEMWS